MAVGTRGTNTQQEALKRLLADISEIKTFPDADLEFLIGLETSILKKIKEPIDAMMGQLADQGALPPQNGGGMQSQMPMVGQPTPTSGGIGGMTNGLPLPNPDELRRMLRPS